MCFCILLYKNLTISYICLLEPRDLPKDSGLQFYQILASFDKVAFGILGMLDFKSTPFV